MKKYLIVFLFPFVGCNCKKNLDERSVIITNNATHSITYYFLEHAEHKYPDTAIETSVVLTSLPPGRSTTLFLGDPAYVYKYQKVERMCLFTFHTDTISKYNWDVIRSEYKVLKRYDLSYDDLKQRDFNITLP